MSGRLLLLYYYYYYFIIIIILLHSYCIILLLSLFLLLILLLLLSVLLLYIYWKSTKNFFLQVKHKINVQKLIFILDAQTLVGWCPMKSLLSYCLSLCLAVRPSVTKFSQDWITSFFDIVDDDSWPWYLETGGARFLKKKFDGINFGQMGQSWAQD